LPPDVRFLRLKMHKNRFRLGFRPRPRWLGSLQRSSKHPSWSKGDLLLGEGKRYRKGKGGQGGEGRGRERTGEERKGMEGTPVCIFKFSLE